MTLRFGAHTEQVEALLEEIRWFDENQRALLCMVSAADFSDVSGGAWVRVTRAAGRDQFPYAAGREAAKLLSGPWALDAVFAECLRDRISDIDYLTMRAAVTFVSDPPAWNNDSEWMRLFMESVGNLGIHMTRRMVDTLASW